uniref:Uncharacterized protein TCIL3000_10_1120 n=1 Tax=Trypanosoma congolense (strain IL3000) TaxID=1068625 RepID=G0UVD8_TRYCI|nr:unnamed protein product [Trypanosoma congolense IL3000]
MYPKCKLLQRFHCILLVAVSLFLLYTLQAAVTGIKKYTGFKRSEAERKYKQKIGAMALSNRVIVFPYIPPSDAAFAGLCLRARPGEKAQVARKVGDWAVLEVGGRIGLYPLAYTVKVTEHKSCVNGGGRVAAAPDTLSSRKSPTAKGKDDAFEKYSERRDTVASPELGVKNDAEPSGVNIGVHTARRVTVPQDTHYSNANDTTALFTRMRHDTKSGVRVTLGGCGAVSDEEGRVGDGDCDRVSDTSRYDCHLMSSSEKNDHRPKSLVRQEGAEKRERLCSAIGSLRKQFVDLDLEVEWTNNIAARIQAIRQYLIDARNPESIPCGVQRSHPPREEQKAAEVTRPGGLDLEVLKKVIYQLQNTLLMYAKGSGATSSSVEGYSTPAEDETMGEVAALKHDECGSELEQLWHGSLGPEMKSELQSIEECIQRELETFSYYTSQRQRLQANAERLLSKGGNG